MVARLARGGSAVASHLAEPERPSAKKGGSAGGHHLASVSIALVLLIIGAAMLVYPAFSAVMAQEDVIRQVREYGAGQAVWDEAESSDGEGASDQEFRPKEDDPIYEALVEYNERVREGEGDLINDPFATEGGGISALGVPEGLIGTLEVPSMSVTLPLYLGATADNLSRGATVIAGTSMPIGGESTNCAIAAHRGGIWSGFQMFRDIEEMKEGDTVTVTTPWERLTYQAVGIAVVDPSDVESLGIQQGRDMLTLLTCHPYGVSSDRYLVYCERVDNADAQESPGVLERAIAALLPAPAEDSPSSTIEFWLKVVGLAIVGVVIVVLAVDLVRTLVARSRT